MTIRFFIATALFAAPLLFLSACTGPEKTAVHLPPVRNDMTYSCSNARQFTVNFDENGEKATIMYDGNSHTLWRTGQAPVFTNNFYTLYISDEGVLRLNRFDVPILDNCIIYTL